MILCEGRIYWSGGLRKIRAMSSISLSPRADASEYLSPLYYVNNAMWGISCRRMHGGSVEVTSTCKWPEKNAQNCYNRLIKPIYSSIAKV